MNAGNASADGSENLVRDRVGPGGYLVGGDFRVALTAEENNLISLLNISYIGNIDHSQIHAHSASHFGAFTADENFTAIGKKPPITIGIADRQGGDEAFTLCDERLTVADTRP